MDAPANARILLVDDEPRNLQALRELLGGLGEELLLARSGEEALRQALRHELVVVLLDVRMPGMDGFETARLLRERERTRLTPIIFLTAAADEVESVFRGYQVGAVDYLVKPLVPEVLRSKVAVFVELHRKSAALAGEIAERRRAEERLRASEERLRELAAHLVSVREEERVHIAREIHDELGQVLTGLKMDVTWLAGKLAQPELLRKTAAMSALIDSTIRTVRRIASGLRPEVLDDMGLVAGIDWQAKEFQKRTGIRCRVALPAENAAAFGSELSITTFRIFQEILTNVARHARATRLEVELSRRDGQLLLQVADNGVGISPEQMNGRRSLGLLGMQERARRLGGEVRISGGPGKGTRVTVAIPYAEAAS
jgi:signal transduction histidine kinase